MRADLKEIKDDTKERLGDLEHKADSLTFWRGVQQGVAVFVFAILIPALGWLYISVRNKNYTRLIHRLIAEAFIPNPHSLPEVNHINGNKNDYSIENLEWSSALNNIRHAIQTGLAYRGEKNSQSKLSDMQVIQIKALLQQGTPKAEIAQMFGVRSGAIRNIASGRNWSWLQPQHPDLSLVAS